MIERLRFVGVTGEPLAGRFHSPSPVDPDQGMRANLLVAHFFLRRIRVESTARGNEIKAGKEVWVRGGIGS
jgi:hypothetical protein